MKYFIFIYVFFTVPFLKAQDGQDEFTFNISLDAESAINKAHPYYDFFSDQDEAYIIWLYATNKNNQSRELIAHGEQKVIKDEDGNNSLVFAIEKNGELYYDTLRNSVHDLRRPSKIKRFFQSLLPKINVGCSGFQQDLTGNLPKGSMMWLEDKNWGLKFGVMVPGVTADVKVDIRDKDGNHIVTIVDHELKRGWNNFKWRRNKNPRGIYNISVTMDGKTMTQNFQI